MTARFSEQLRQQAEPIWQAMHDHPFIRGLGSDTLEPARFLVWLRQSYLESLDRARLLALASVRAPDLDAMKWLLGTAHAVVHQDLLLHQAYAIEFGLAEGAFAASEKHPTTRAYGDHLLRTAALGSFLEMLAAVLPGMWSLAELATRLLHSQAGHGRYDRWIETCSASAERARRGGELFDRLAEQAGPADRAAAAEAFAVSSHYAWQVWEMCYHGASEFGGGRPAP